LFLVGIVLYQRYGETFLRLTLYAINFTIGVQVLASFVYRTGSRGSIFFNNPNQLGYFALLAACVIVLLHWRLRLNLIVTSVMLASCGYLSALSASRSALGGIALLLALLVFSNPRVIIGVVVAAVLLLFVGGPVANAVDAAENRVRNRHSNAGFFEERGYDRIWEHQEYLVFGAGEGGLSRFDGDRKFRMEIHSSAGTVLFSYGIIGATLFLLFMWRLMRGAGWRLMIVLVPPISYAVAHQSLRFTLLWVLLAIFVVVKHERAGARARPASVARTPDPRLIRST
ncbi:MAG: hypothetical protein HOV81_33195, partial [Kofleriaceae bacterium]|nr:hypothetical protein [Kofleriaceae bacterium]